ncbi:MAG TPA: NAD-dependent epimerase/dehydratase family protein [Thermomicrobiales bacterium]|nr:NAD-dependent epimerase/dehydratase family protein [Thermomicrobiales bacterium]
MTMPKTLVTGATGRVGSRFVPRLLERGGAVRVLVRDAERGAVLGRRGAEVAVGDLRRPETLAPALAGVEAVVHLGASFRGVADAEAVAVNLAGTLALARAATLAGVHRFVYASTNLVYGPGRGRPAREDDEPRLAEDARAYPASKLAAERALAELARAEGLGLRVLRLAFVYGEGDPHLGEVTPQLQSWPAAKRLHMVHHADVAQALLLALAADDVDGRTYNVADDAPVTAADLLRLSGLPAPEEAAGQAPADPWEGIVDTARLRDDLGFRPTYPSVVAARDAGAL